MGEKPTQSRERGQGGTSSLFVFPLAESRGSASGRVWGNAPTVSRVTSMLNALNKGRRQRSVPASNFALPQKHPPSCLFLQLNIVAPDGRDQPAWEKIFSRCWSFLLQGGIASAEATRGLSDRPLDPFGADTPMFLDFFIVKNALAFLDFPVAKSPFIAWFWTSQENSPVSPAKKSALLPSPVLFPLSAAYTVSSPEEERRKIAC